MRNVRSSHSLHLLGCKRNPFFRTLYGMKSMLKGPEPRVSKAGQLDAMCPGITQDQEQLLSEDAASLDLTSPQLSP